MLRSRSCIESNPRTGQRTHLVIEGLLITEVSRAPFRASLRTANGPSSGTKVALGPRGAGFGQRGPGPY